MGNRVRALTVLTVLGVGFAVTPADAVSFGESRFFTFAIPCDGTSKQVLATVTGLGPSTTRSIEGAQVALIQYNPGQDYVLLSVSGIANRTLLSLGATDTRAANYYRVSFFEVTTDASGNVKFVVAGACQAGAGTVRGSATVVFTAVP
jgi:hypothetical protein